MDNFFYDIVDIIRDTNINEFIEYSNNLFDNKLSFEDIYKYISLLQPIKKYILFIVHFIRSYKGEKKYNYAIHKYIKCKFIIDDSILLNDFKHVYYLNDYMLTTILLNTKGASSEYKLLINYYNYILNKNKLNLLISKQKLNYSHSLNKYLSNDLIEKICEEYIISNYNIILKKVINECIFITKNQYIKYYRLFDKPNRVYGKSWNFDNYLSNKNFRPCSYIIYNLQILPYLFDKHNIDCKCDRCLYNIDYPRIRYIFNHYNNPISGHYSNYFNNYIKLILNININRGLNYNNKYNKHHYNNDFILGFHRKDKKYKHIILKNNTSKWHQLIKIWNQTF